MPSTIFARVVHWLVGDTFNLNIKKLALIQTPLDNSKFMLFPSNDGILGFTGVLGSHIIFFQLDNASSLASPWVVEYYVSDSDEGEEEQGDDRDDDDDYEGTSTKTHKLHKILALADAFDNVDKANLSIFVPKNCEVGLTTVSGYILQL
uniref:Uncharacterized protein n=1 Tax=Oryza punctata TaxID=4537 RepID=A0A0E0M5D4_ORYPU